MALTYITKAAEMAARQNQSTASQINTVLQKLAREQERKNKKADEIVRKGQAYTDDFYKLYGEQTKSGTEAWNSGASQLVGKLAAEQEELYTKAFGASGTPEDKHAWRLRQIRDKQILSQVGSWAAISNENATAMQENQSAHDQDIDLGRMTRGNDTDKYSFSQNMQNDQYSQYNFDIDEKGNVILNAQNIDADGNIVANDVRNLSADVADNKAGNEWYSQIKKEDLLENKLNPNWTDKNTGYNTYFKKKTESNRTYDATTGKWTTVTKEVYDRDEVKDALMNTYANRLDSEIKGPGFEKTWDQLWRGGYLKNDNGKANPASEMSWSEYRKIKSMTFDQFKESYGDLTGDGIVNDDDKQFLEKQVMSTAREGLANYYSGTMVPAEDQITNTSTSDAGTAKPGTASPISDDDRRKYEAEKRYYNAVRSNSPKIVKDYPITIDEKTGKVDPKQYGARVRAITKEMNNNIPQKDLGKGYNYVTGQKAAEIFNQNSQDAPVPPLESMNIYRLVPYRGKTKDDPAVVYKPVLIMTQEYVMTSDPNVLTERVASGIGIDDEAQNYLKTKELKTQEVNNDYAD